MDPLEEHRNLYREGALVVRPSDITLNDAHMISVDVLDFVSFQLQYEAEENGLKGLVPPSRLYNHYREKTHLEAELRVPVTSGGINMHYLENQHYVVSHKIIADTGPIIKVYDSLPPGERMWIVRLKDLPTQLRLLYGDINNIEVICAQHQGYNATATANCAIFTIANTIMLLKNQDPCEYTLLKNMRKQLIDMLNAGVFQPFLATKRDNPLRFTNEERYAKVQQRLFSVYK